MQIKIAAAMLLGATSLFAQCNTQNTQIRTHTPWSASFYYPSSNGTTLNQYVDVTVDAPITVNEIYSTSYDQAAGATTPPNQVGNIAEVRVYTFPVTHIGSEGSQTGWTHVATGEMTIAAWNGDCVTQNFKDPGTGVLAPFVMPAGTYGVCIEYIPTSWVGTVSLPQTQTLLNPGVLSTLGFVPTLYPTVMADDQFMSITNGTIQTGGWQVVDPAGVLGPNAAPGGTAPSTQPNIGFEYTPDANSGRWESTGDGCYELPFMLYEQIPANTNPIDLINTQYTAILTASANGGFYQVIPTGIPYLPPPAGATNLTMGGTAATPVANSSGNLDDCTFGYTMLTPLPLPSPGGGLMATELGINSNGKIYFDTVAPSATSYGYNGANYGGITGFRDLATQWALFNCDLDPSVGGDIYVMEPSPNLGGVMIWWDNVPNWPAVAGVANSMSIEFTNDGSVVNIAYGAGLAADGGGNDAIVGFSAGNGEVVGGAIDWSAIPATGVVSGDGSSAPTMALSARPVTSSVIDLVLGNLPAPLAPGIPRIGLFVLSANGPIPGGLDLGFVGMPGCSLYQAPDFVHTAFENVAAPGDIRLPFALPAAVFSGFDIHVQGAALHAVLQPNALGMTVSNGVCLTLGTL